jgi:hypothetical protein
LKLQFTCAENAGENKLKKAVYSIIYHFFL